MHSKKVLSVFIASMFCLALISMLAHLGWTKLHPESDAKADDQEIVPNSIEPIDFGKLYPRAEAALVPEKAPQNLIQRFLQTFKNFSDYRCGLVEALPKDHLPFKSHILNQYGRLNRLLGVTFIKSGEDIVIQTQNDYLTFLQTESNINATLDRLTEFSDWLKQNGMNFLYAAAPSKMLAEKDEVTGVAENIEAYKQTELIERLENTDVGVLNIREFFPKDYDEYMSLFYKTDHHWKGSAGLKAASILTERLNQGYGCTFDLTLFEPSLYETVVYPQALIGAQGKMETLGFIGKLEDFGIPFPEFPVSIHIEVPNWKMVKDGDFNVLINETVLTEQTKLDYTDPYGRGAYGAWLYGNTDFVRIHSNYANCDKKILVLKDSFANAVNPYLALQCQQLDIIDLRHFRGSLRAYLRQNPYDIVVLLMRNTGIGNDADSEELWNFQ